MSEKLVSKKPPLAAVTHGISRSATLPAIGTSSSSVMSPKNSSIVEGMAADATTTTTHNKKQRKKRRKSTKTPVEDLFMKASQNTKATVLVSSNRLTSSKVRDEWAAGGGGFGGSDDNDDHSESHSMESMPSMYSLRSMGSINSMSSLASASSRMSTAAMINEMKRRVQSKLPRPDYVARLEELQGEQLSWDKKMPRKGFDRKNPPVNIIPCHIPLETILAKADRRMRKQQKTVKMKQVKCEEWVKKIDEGLQFKFTRAERYQAIFERQQKRVFWLKVLFMNLYISQLRERYIARYEATKQMQRIVKTELLVKRAMMKWFSKHAFKKSLTFLRHMKKAECAFRLAIRIRRKRKATEVIKQALYEFVGQHQVRMQSKT